MRKKSNMIALSGYCNEKGLSIPKHLTVDFLQLEYGIVAVPNGYKFKREDLDKVIPKCGLVLKKKVERAKPQLHIYSVSIEEFSLLNLKLLVNQPIGHRNHETIKDELNGELELELEEVLNLDGKDFISSVKVLNEFMGVESIIEDELGKMKVEYLFQLKESWFGTVLDKTIEQSK